MSVRPFTALILDGDNLVQFQVFEESVRTEQRALDSSTVGLRS